LSDREISDYVKQLGLGKKFRGVFCRDELPVGGPKHRESGVVNLDRSSGGGTHWVAYDKEGDTVAYYDSLGNLKPPTEVSSYFKGYKLRYNRERDQSLDTITCGQLCLLFLLKQARERIRSKVK
jgi:hypothetical protein